MGLTVGRVMVRPGYLVLRRAGDVVQIGLHPDRAVLLDLPAGSRDPVLAAIDGTRTAAEAVESAVQQGADQAAATALVERLESAGLLVDAERWSAWTRDCLGSDPARRLPDLCAWQAHADAGVVLAARAEATVRIQGAGRVGAAVALLLSAAGIGRLEVLDGRPVSGADLTPFGYRPDQVDQTRQHAVADLIAESSPAAPRRRGTRQIDLVVLCPDSPEPDREQVAELVRDGVPHLPVRVHESTGSVGPLVLPGRSACLRCTDLHRSDRDPGWPALLAQLTRVEAPAPETVLAAQLAALAAAQVLHYLAGGEPITLDHSTETELVGGLSHLRAWPPHPCCGCQWHTADPAPTH